MNSIQAPAPIDFTKTHVQFDKNEFDKFIWDKGRAYEVYLDRSIKCPCKIKSGDNLSSCLNCGGSGIVYVNRTQTRMFLQGMNMQTQYKDWSETNVGLARISMRDIERVSYMDRITLIEAESVYSEILYPILYNETLYLQPFYEIKEIIDAYAFISDSEPLKKLVENIDYKIENNKVNISNFLRNELNYKISLRYTHRPQYSILDITRDVAHYENIDGKTTNFPIAAIGRRSHYVIDVNNHSGSILFDNTL